MAKINAAVDARQSNHHKPLYFFVCSIFKNFSKNKVALSNEKNSFQLVHIAFLFVQTIGIAIKAAGSAIIHLAATIK